MRNFFCSIVLLAIATPAAAQEPTINSELLVAIQQLTHKVDVLTNTVASQSIPAPVRLVDTRAEDVCGTEAYGLIDSSRVYQSVPQLSGAVQYRRVPFFRDSSSSAASSFVDGTLSFRTTLLDRLKNGVQMRRVGPYLIESRATLFGSQTNVIPLP